MTNQSTKYNIFSMKKMYSFRFDEKIINKAKLESAEIGISLSAYICLLLRKSLITPNAKAIRSQADDKTNKSIVQIAENLKEINCVLQKISEMISK